MDHVAQRVQLSIRFRKANRRASSPDQSPITHLGNAAVVSGLALDALSIEHDDPASCGLNQFLRLERAVISLRRLASCQ
jgi:hypothetical protein